MKLLLKNLTLRHYIRHVRRQNKHVQHIHAFLFAGIITGLIAAFILYTDYGFWHERYVADDSLVVGQTDESSDESASHFWQEAKERFNSIGKASGTLLEGKVEYKKGE